MLSAGEIEEGLVLGYERRGFEVKGAGLRSDMPLLIKVVRAALGLGNLQDGGHVIIGIDDKKLAQMEPGTQCSRALLTGKSPARVTRSLPAKFWHPTCTGRLDDLGQAHGG